MRIKAEASSSMQLLRSMLPGTVIRKLKAGQTYIAQYHEQVWCALSKVGRVCAHSSGNTRQSGEGMCPLL